MGKTGKRRQPMTNASSETKEKPKSFAQGHLETLIGVLIGSGLVIGLAMSFALMQPAVAGAIVIGAAILVAGSNIAGAIRDHARIGAQLNSKDEA